MDMLVLALGILVLTLLGMLLWFVPHLLHQQSSHVASETGQLREMLLDLLNEQQAVTIRQAQLGSSLTSLRDHLEGIAKSGVPVSAQPQLGLELQRVETQMSDMQILLYNWVAKRETASNQHSAQHNESWAHLLSLLSTIQGRIGDLSQERAATHVGTQATQMLHELEQEMINLRSISEDIERLQWRLRKSLHEREGNMAHVRTHLNNAS